MNRNHQSTAFWSVLSIVSIFLGMIFFLGVPRYRIILSDISDPHELQFLKFMREDLSQIEAWSPRFANRTQIQLLVQRIRNGHETDYHQLLRSFTEDMSDDARQVLDFQNCLIQELINSPKAPKLSKLRRVSVEKAEKMVEQVLQKILSYKKEEAYIGIMSTTSDPTGKYGNISGSTNKRGITMNTLIWKYRLPAYPADTWWNRFCGAGPAWRKKFNEAVQKEVLPTLQWYDEVQTAKTLDLIPKSSNTHFFQLQMDSDPILEREKVWADYSLFLCEETSPGVFRKYDTGVKLIRTRLYPNEGKGLPTDQKWIVYSHQSAQKIALSPVRPTYGSQNVADFLYDVGIPKNFQVRIVKENLSELCSLFELEYVLEHNDFPEWRSDLFKISLSSKECSLTKAREEIKSSLARVRTSLWTHILKMRTFHEFPITMETTSEEMLKSNKPLQCAGVLKGGEKPITIQILLGEDLDVHTNCIPNAAEYSVLRSAMLQDLEVLQKFDGFLRLGKIQIYGNRLKGRGYIDISQFEIPAETFPQEQTQAPVQTLPSVLSFEFWLFPDGTLELQLQPILGMLKTLQLKAGVPTVNGELTAEEVQEKVQTFLEGKYPHLAKSFSVISNKSGNRLWYEIHVQLSDYPVLVLGPDLVQKGEDLEEQAARLFETLADVSNTQWGERYEHLRYGEICSSLYSWTPENTSRSGIVKNTIVFADSEFSMDWYEDLFIQKNGDWHEYTPSEIATLFEKRAQEICNWTQTLIQQVYGLNVLLNKEAEEPWVRLYPLKFSMSVRCLKPFGWPINFQMGKIRISAKGLEFPQSFELDTAHTFWLSSVGITDPYLKLDLDKKRVKGHASFTPSLKSLYQAAMSEYLSSQNITEEELEEYGYALEVYNSPTGGQEELESLSIQEDPDLENPWLHLLRADISGLGDWQQKHLGGSGDFYFTDFSSFGISGFYAPDHLELNSDLSTSLTDEDFPVHLDGGILFTEKEKKANLGGLMCGTFVTGNGKIRQDENARHIFGLGGSAFVPSFLTNFSIQGESSVDLHKYGVDGNATLAHPLMTVFGTVRAGAYIWKTTESDKGFRLYLEWVDPDGRRHFYEEEFYDASAIDVEELVQKMEKIQKKKEERQPASEAEQNMFAAAGDVYEDPVSKPSEEKDKEGKATPWKALQNFMPNELSQLNKLMGQKESTSSDQPPLLSGGEIEVQDDGTFAAFIMKENGKCLFRLRKSDMRISGNAEDDYDASILLQADGSGVILLIELAALQPPMAPRFIRVHCSSREIVSKVEVIVPGNTKSWKMIEPLFDRANITTETAYAAAVVTAQELLFKEMQCDIANVKNQNGLCSYTFQLKEYPEIRYHDLFFFENWKPRNVLIPSSVIPDATDMDRNAELLVRPLYADRELERTCVLAATENRDAFLLLSLNDLTDPHIRVRRQTGDSPEGTLVGKPILSWNDEKYHQAWNWILGQYLDGDLSIDEGTTVSIGEEGIAVLYSSGVIPTLELLPVKRLRKDVMNPAQKVTQKDLEVWNADTERFLPKKLQNSEARRMIDLKALAELAVSPWIPSQNQDENAWQCAPMGLLAGLGRQKNALENEQGNESEKK